MFELFSLLNSMQDFNVTEWSVSLSVRRLDNKWLIVGYIAGRLGRRLSPIFFNTSKSVFPPFFCLSIHLGS